MGEMDLHSLMIAESASSDGGTLTIARGAARSISVPDVPVHLEIAIAAVVVGEWSEVAEGAKPRIDFEVTDPAGKPTSAGVTVAVTPPAQAHADEPLVLPLGFTAAFTVNEPGKHTLTASVAGKVLKRVPFAVVVPSPGSDA